MTLSKNTNITTGTIDATSIIVEPALITLYAGSAINVRDGVNLSPHPHPYELRLQRIEKMLGIANRDLVLEAEFPELAAIGDSMDGVLDAVILSEFEAISIAVAQYTSFADECNIMKKLKLNNDPID
jgi:hypothetical protein